MRIAPPRPPATEGRRDRTVDRAGDPRERGIPEEPRDAGGDLPREVHHRVRHDLYEPNLDPDAPGIGRALSVARRRDHSDATGPIRTPERRRVGLRVSA